MEITPTSRGQMTLPYAIRERLGLCAGDKLTVTLQDDQTIVLKRPAAMPISRLRGLLPQPARALSPEALSPEEMDAGVSRYLQHKHSR